MPERKKEAVVMSFLYSPATVHMNIIGRFINFEAQSTFAPYNAISTEELLEASKQ